MGIPSRWSKVRPQRWWLWGWLPPENILSHYLKKNICMLCSWNLQSMLESPFPFFISQKPGEIPIFRTFLAKFSIFAYISLKIGYFELSDDYDVTVMSYLLCWYVFWYVWKGEIPSYTMVPIRCIWWFHEVKGGGNTGDGNPLPPPSPLVKCVTKKAW